ncbi:YndM family protein [Bacillus paramycoides]|uniref:YndM family protein n=1 Tax=Bacillus paramycoides TaxID=2026194 RepID=UPI002E22AC4D|nr:YndM family protein [Bacillus paramycoides]MED1103390.1 YndM family protein [Bacillus paramycoides]MED1116100.1 YndM family protein [Bacillus paramycoides]MED1558956.1 YndM family protein [Bacillus paramycoides]
MNDFTVIVIKFISSIIAFSIGLALFFPATLVQIISFSLFVTIVSYMFVNKIILNRIGDSAAIMTNFLLTYLSVWIFGNILLDNYMQIAWGSILSAIVFTLSEVIVHRFSHSRTRHNNDNIRINRRFAYGTEFAEEQNILDKDKKK